MMLETHGSQFAIYQLNKQGMADWLIANKPIEKIINLAKFGIWLCSNESNEWTNDQDILVASELILKEACLSRQEEQRLALFAAETCLECVDDCWEYLPDAIELTYEEICEAARDAWLRHAGSDFKSFMMRCNYAPMAIKARHLGGQPLIERVAA
ncbi:hypothetical protein D0962_23460 [Leptolyngbyaceae cyanobacterium CCMR0082]|uniref:Uncharacterized protein n=1 Tax=Adonisia turfae CCMR0082 TaxID=2304604 RepID=A0A6M0SB07_9CYAN|nr:hypothetical protein [Adonisia turfae]NEZ65678.1 hypothetical protein [Adonisia turfae CCMR0082]